MSTARAYGRIESLSCPASVALLSVIQTQPIAAEGEQAKGGRRLLGGAGLGAGAGGVAAAASSTPEAEFSSESLLQFVVAVPVQVGNAN